MTDADETDGGSGMERAVTNSKVARVVEEYDLGGFGAELEARWTGERSERSSLRDLAAALNRRLLRGAMEDAGRSPLESDVESTYEALTDDAVSSGVRTQVERDLERSGVDVERLRGDFVTHQAVHTYLTGYREAELPTADVEPRSKATETIERLRSRAVAVVDDTLDRLRRGGHLSTGDLDVFVDVRVACSECGRQYDVSTLLQEGSCECEASRW